ncbi:hypothetical protein ASF49_00115 [Methylobacterium sp. Leaf104]|uniref:hypothetical protein n=1 Tax=Methylobacterium TaxID=407 RepID=UPI0006FA8D5F|nr:MULTISPECIES: hypothetical protein [Methylobacterium]KQP42306.1 hypothetical protein ASF49_00115 [Methylobacterium sp. Leaf104]MCI9879181.1 hypothetical protein [Methylobacterium goesingense]
MADQGAMRPTLPIGETLRDGGASGLRSVRALGSATTVAFVVVLAKEAAHTLMGDPTAPARFQDDVFLVDCACTILLAPYWMAMFRLILDAGGSVRAVAEGRAGPFRDFLALELFWLLVSGLLDRALSSDMLGPGRLIVGFSAWIALLLLQIRTSMLAPALALGAPDATLRAVFAMTRGAAARIGLILIATILPLGLVDRMLHAPERTGADLPAFVLAVRILASGLIDMALLVLVTALLAEIYRRLRTGAGALTPRP